MVIDPLHVSKVGAEHQARHELRTCGKYCPEIAAYALQLKILPVSKQVSRLGAAVAGVSRKAFDSHNCRLYSRENTLSDLRRPQNTQNIRFRACWQLARQQFADATTTQGEYTASVATYTHRQAP